MLEILTESADELVAFRIQGRHLQEEAHKLAGMIDARIERYGHARCLVEISNVDGVDLGALREGLGFDLEHGKQIDRCAVLGDAAWETWLVSTLRLFFRQAEVRHFAGGERDLALQWLREGA